MGGSKGKQDMNAIVQEGEGEGGGGGREGRLSASSEEAAGLALFRLKRPRCWQLTARKNKKTRN